MGRGVSTTVTVASIVDREGAQVPTGLYPIQKSAMDRLHWWYDGIGEIAIGVNRLRQGCTWLR